MVHRQEEEGRRRPNARGEKRGVELCHGCGPTTRMLAVNINHLWNEPLKFNKQLFRFLALSIRRGNFQANFVSAAVNNCSLAIIPDLTRFLILIIPILGGSVTQFKVGTSLEIYLSKEIFCTCACCCFCEKKIDRDWEDDDDGQYRRSQL